MYQLIEENGVIKAKGTFATETIHMFHCSKTLEELREDVATPYLVAEECGNFARVHLLTEFSEDEALQKIAEYLREKEDVKQGEEHLIGVFKCKF